MKLYHTWEYTQKMLQYIKKDTYFTMFISNLFILARSWKEPRCPSTDEWKIGTFTQWSTTQQLKTRIP
jgi:hypothetical protein